MPRPKVLDKDRRRILNACIFCRRTKQKCDGLIPCVQCQRRGRASTCAYSSHKRSCGHHRLRRKDVKTLEGTALPDQASSKTESRQIVHNDEERVSTITKVTIPRLLYHVCDTKGRVLYIGHCATLSFLQYIYELIAGEKGLATFAADMESFPVYEELPPVRSEEMLTYNVATVQELQELINVFFVSTCGILDIFGRAYLEDLLNIWANGTLDTNSGGAAILYLSIALAAQVRSATVIDIQRAQTFYYHGRQIALQELTNDPTLETVQAFILISLYMLGSSRCNGAFLNLGIAISAAKSLGIHHSETNIEFSDNESRLRKRIWRTIRYHDLFFCAMMGRTSSIITTDSSLEDVPPLSCWTCPDFCQELGLLESARAFSFVEEIVNHIYTKPNIPLDSLQQISQELKEASSKVPAELRTVEVSNSALELHQVSQANILRNAYVACNYYFSMMLLTRPFHITSLRAKYSCARSTYLRLDSNATTDTKAYFEIMQGTMESIDSATKTIQLLHELMVAGILFNNMALAVAWTFVAALTVCSAYFSRLGDFEECKHAIQQANEVLQHFSRNSLQARQYNIILKKLSRAALDHVKALERKERADRPILMPELFRLNLTTSQKNERRRIPMDIPPQQTEYQGQNGGIPVSISEGNYGYIFQEYANQGRTLGVDANQINAATFATDSTSLLEIAHTFQDLNTVPFEIDTGGINRGYIDPNLATEYIDNGIFKLENMESTCDINWGMGFL
ncbi:hypothetical protein F5884DRAFT_107910 [Xylogone sp. PMI_703]|nr:hypothetical protein F5884DRAFT_107910 [Xylogone sp. PMI_703]